LDRSDYQILVSALGGGLAGSILTQAVGWLSRWFYRPDLELLFGEAELPALSLSKR
jgi:hypothetical protein